MKRSGRRFFPAVVLSAALVLLLLSGAAAEDQKKVSVYFFWGKGCPHCAKEEPFLDALKGKYPQMQVKSYEVWYSRENARLFAELNRAFGIQKPAVPMTFIGDLEPVVGYYNDEITGKEIEEKVAYCVEQVCPDAMDRLTRRQAPKIEAEADREPATPERDITEEKKEQQEKRLERERAPEKKEGAGVQGPPKEEKGVGEEREPQAVEEPRAGGRLITLPFLGRMDTGKTSLPMLTVLIAGMDSFNPCAFFVLFLLLSVLVYAQSRRKMLLIGGIFVFFSGFIYFLFMAAWLNIFLIMGKQAIITTIAGLVALFIAALNIKDYFFFARGVSLVIPEKAKPKLFDRIRRLIKTTSLSSVLVGTVVLAITANTYELLCTAGFPMVYTRALTLHNLPQSQYYLYLALYNVIYVIPLLVIVIMFAATLGARKLTEQEGQTLKLVSGLMMLCLGIVLLLRPDLLSNVFVSAGLLLVALAVSAITILITKRFRGR